MSNSKLMDFVVPEFLYENGLILRPNGDSFIKFDEFDSNENMLTKMIMNYDHIRNFEATLPTDLVVIQNVYSSGTNRTKDVKITKLINIKPKSEPTFDGEGYLLTTVDKDGTKVIYDTNDHDANRSLILLSTFLDKNNEGIARFLTSVTRDLAEARIENKFAKDVFSKINVNIT